MNKTMQRRKAFTLIEVLVVIAVMAFLMSMTFWGLSEIKKGVLRKQAKTLVERVSSSIRSFHAEYRFWPTQAYLDSLSPKQTWYEFLNQGYADVKAGASTSPKFEYRGPWLVMNDSELDTNGDIVDVWRNPIVIEVNNVLGKVLVYSFGEDGESDNGRYEGDGLPDAYTTPDPIDDMPAEDSGAKNVL